MEQPRLERFLQVGLTSLVDAEPALVKGMRFASIIRGWSEGDYILLETARGESPSRVLRPGEACVVRFMAAGQAFAFVSAVRDSGSGNYYRFFRVQWPRRLETVVLRQADRVEMQAPCQIMLEGGHVLQGRLIDLSTTGCRLELDGKVEKESPFRLSFQLPDGATIEGLAARARSTAPGDKGFILGCEFISPSPAQRADVEFYIGTTIDRLKPESHERKDWVLVVDPIPESVGTLRSQFGKRGIQVVNAASPVFGLSRLGASTPLAVLLAYEQEGCTGVDACKLIAAAPRLKHVPVYIYARDAEDPHALGAEAKAAGAAGVCSSLAKAESLADLVAQHAAPPA